MSKPYTPKIITANDLMAGNVIYLMDQDTARASLPTFETQTDAKTKINPLARWSAQDIHIYMKKHDSPAQADGEVRKKPNAAYISPPPQQFRKELRYECNRQ